MTTPHLTHQKALRLQKNIFRSLKEEAALLFGKMPASILQYEKENKSDFRLAGKQFKTIQKKALIDAARKTDVTFIADFHTFDQAQRTALRIIRETIQPHRPLMIGLELVSSHFQNDLDHFQAGKISLEEFHKIISYHEEWGFPWKNYTPLFDWARENKVRLIALNRPKILFQYRDIQELHKRDQWSAGVITDAIQDGTKKDIRPQMIILYGELHVGTRHLPRQLTQISTQVFKKPLSWITIHQNEDRLFWKLAEKNRDLHSEIIKLKQNIYCVFSGTPWAKLQSLISWAEGETTDTPESEQDYLSIISTYGKTVAEFLEVTPPSYESLTMSTMNQTGFLENLKASRSLSSTELKLIRFLVAHNQRFYIHSSGITYLASPSHNGAAELASIHLLRAKNKSDVLFNHQEDDFFRLVLEFSFGFLGSLIFNPRRKCDLPKDHLKRLNILKKGAKPTFPLEREARKIALGILNNRTSPGLDIKTVMTRKNLAPAAIMGAKYLGKILGKRLHQSILAESVDIQTLRSLFFLEPEKSPRFYAGQYQKLIHAASQATLAPSKNDQL